MSFERLFEPVKLGSLVIKNRYGMAPTNCMFADWTGMVSDDDLAFWVARAKGGAGLIIVGSVLVTELGKQVAPHPWIHMTGIEHVPRLALLAESIHRCGSKAIVQMLVAPGSRARPVSGESPVAPSAGVAYKYGEDKAHPKADALIAGHSVGPWVKEMFLSNYPAPCGLGADEIEALVAEVAHNAKLAVLAGFDGVEVHTCHHYLIDEFRAPCFNKRRDRYGGSREKRHRLLIDLVQAVTKSAKEERPDFVVGVRVGSECGGEGGYTFDDTKWLAPQLEALGIDYWHVTFGWPPTPETSMDSKTDGGYLPWARELKKILKIPVLTPSVHSPELARKAVVEGWTDMITLARPLMADPDYPNKVKANRVRDIVRCNKDGHCWVGVDLRLPLRCSVNPVLGREKNLPKYQLREGFRGRHMLPGMLGGHTK
jgi:2,4-dienoyl-CoA reductase-like NADH-dependent reductase (Old Yellow Enzyme family)